MARLLTQILSTAGDGTGTTDATGNYATVADDFYLEPAADKTIAVHRLMIQVRDTGTFDSTAYGNAVTLTNGIEVIYEENGTEYDLTPEPIIINADWAKYCYDTRVDTYGSGDQLLSARWTFTKHGQPLILQGHKDEKLIVRLNDDFSALNAQTFIAQGLIFDSSSASDTLYK